MIRTHVPLTPVEGMLLVAILALGMVGSLAIYENRLMHQAVENQEMRGKL